MKLFYALRTRGSKETNTWRYSRTHELLSSLGNNLFTKSSKKIKNKIYIASVKKTYERHMSWHKQDEWMAGWSVCVFVCVWVAVAVAVESWSWIASVFTRPLNKAFLSVFLVFGIWDFGMVVVFFFFVFLSLCISSSASSSGKFLV